MRRVVAKPYPVRSVNSAEQFGQMVLAARTSAGLTRENLALVAGISSKTLAALEHGTSSVGIDKVLNVAQHLGISLVAFRPGEKSLSENLLADLEMALHSS